VCVCDLIGGWKVAEVDGKPQEERWLGLDLMAQVSGSHRDVITKVAHLPGARLDVDSCIRASMATDAHAGLGLQASRTLLAQQPWFIPSVRSAAARRPARKSFRRHLQAQLHRDVSQRTRNRCAARR